MLCTNLNLIFLLDIEKVTPVLSNNVNLLFLTDIEKVTQIQKNNYFSWNYKNFLKEGEICHNVSRFTPPPCLSVRYTCSLGSSVLHIKKNAACLWYFILWIVSMAHTKLGNYDIAWVGRIFKLLCARDTVVM